MTLNLPTLLRGYQIARKPRQTPWPENYERDKVEKYVQYFQKTNILPIPEQADELEPRSLFLVITDLRTKRLASLKRESFEEILKRTGIPCNCFCCRSFATWYILLPTREQAEKLAQGKIITKYFRLQRDGEQLPNCSAGSRPGFVPEWSGRDHSSSRFYGCHQY